MKPIKDENYSFNHVKDRLKERYNIEIDRDFYNKMNKNIKPYISDSRFDYDTDNNGEQEIHPMFIKNTTIKVVYSLSKERITTVLPK